MRASRVLATLALAGLLQQLPAGLACALVRRADSADCAEMARQAGPAIAPASGAGATTSCMLLSPCAQSTVAMRTLGRATGLMLVEHSVPMLSAFDQLHGFTAAPTPPPPKA